MSRPGIVVALAGELRTLTRERLEGGMVTSLSEDVFLTLSGTGPERARAAGARILEHGASALVSWGCATALDRRLSPGDLLMPRTLIADSGGMLSVHDEWHERLRRRLAQHFVVHTGPLVHSTSLLAVPADKHALGRRSGCAAADMESAVLARLAREADVPYVAIRAVVDAADTHLPPRILEAMDEFGRLTPGALVTEVALRPVQWADLWRLARAYRRARTSLRRVLEHTGPELLAKERP